MSEDRLGVGLDILGYEGFWNELTFRAEGRRELSTCPTPQIKFFKIQRPLLDLLWVSFFPLLGGILSTFWLFRFLSSEFSFYFNILSFFCHLFFPVVSSSCGWQSHECRVCRFCWMRRVKSFMEVRHPHWFRR